MPTKNAPFYSCKAGQDAIKSHRTHHGAMAEAGEMGQLWNTNHGSQRQVNRTSSGHWGTFKPDSWIAVDLDCCTELVKLGLIEDES